MSIGTCKKCGLSVFNNHHKCPPKWFVTDPENIGTDWADAHEIFAYDAEDAAMKAAEMFDNEDGGAPTERVIAVCPAANTDNSEVTRFHITFEHSVTYHAREEGTDE